MKKADRERLASSILDIAHAYGAYAEVFRQHGDLPTETHVRIDTGRLSVSFTLNSRVQHPEVVVLPWNTRVPMDRTLLDGVNPHHGCKLTATVYSTSDLLEHIDMMLRLDKSSLLYAAQTPSLPAAGNN